MNILGIALLLLMIGIQSRQQLAGKSQTSIFVRFEANQWNLKFWGKSYCGYFLEKNNFKQVIKNRFVFKLFITLKCLIMQFAASKFPCEIVIKSRMTSVHKMDTRSKIL